MKREDRSWWATQIVAVVAWLSLVAVVWSGGISANDGAALMAAIIAIWSFTTLVLAFIERAR